jgi:predicted ATPase
VSVARAIGFQIRGEVEPEEQLLHYLRAKQMLLVLDNFEHLLDAASLVAKIVVAAPNVQLLVTSRERLNLQAEWLLEVEGLPYPAARDERGLEGIAAYAAVQLFLQGALRISPRFRLTDENRAWVVRICQLLDGIPLGIELAAAWVRVLSLREITSEIQHNLDFLKSSAPVVPERHRSLRAALDHSWNLLTDREKVVLRRLSVFRAGFGRDSAQKVVGAGLEEIASLLDKSLLKRVGEERYDLHELVRQYAAAHLESELQEHDQTHDRHSSCYAALLEQWEGQIRSPRQMEILAELDAEMDNVRLAWNWMVTHRQTQNIQKSLNCLWRFYTIRTQLREGATLFGQAAEALKSVEGTGEAQEAERSAVLAHVLALQGYFYLGLDRRDEGRELLQESRALLHASTDRATLAETLGVLGFMQYRLGEFVEARQLSEESLHLNRALSNQFGTMFCLVTLAYICLDQEAYDEAYAFANESLAISRGILGDPQGTAVSLTVLSAAANRLGRYVEAKRCAEESLQIASMVHDVWGMGIILRQLGLSHLELGEPGRAMDLMRKSVAQFREVGDTMLMVMSLIDMGTAMRASGAYAESNAHFLDALKTAADTKSWAVVLNVLIEIAVTEMEAGAGERALELVLQCQQYPSMHPDASEQAELESQFRLGRWGQQQYPRIERLRAELEVQLTPAQVAAAEAMARSRSLDSLVRELLAGRTEA